MTAVSISERHISRFGIPQDCVVELRSGLAAVFNDGREGLNSNSDASQSSKAALRKCLTCIKKSVPALKIVNADMWASNSAKSSDWIVLFDAVEGVRALQVEGKLGLNFEYPGDKSGTSVTLQGLLDKFTGTKTVALALPFKERMLLVVPRFGKEFMWWKVRKWGKSQTSLRFMSCCAGEFLSLCCCAPMCFCDNDDEKAMARRRVIRDELDL